MPVELSTSPLSGSRPVFLVKKDGLAGAELDTHARAWAEANGFTGEAGRLLVVPGQNRVVGSALFGLGDEAGGFAPLLTGALAKSLPGGNWHFGNRPADPELSCLGLLLGDYVFTRYGKRPGSEIRFTVPEGADIDRLRRLKDGTFLVRDLINTPTNDMGPEALEQEVRALASRFKAKISVTAGDALLSDNFPMIHAVGRAGAEAPRLIDLSWGPVNAPKVTLVGKGVCFDTGGLDIKPSSGMLIMKKDMGGAANVLGLAFMIMSAGLYVRLRVLIPAVENAISGNAFRPGDVLKSRKGITVEIGNTDAEGRLILADALALADEETPDLLIDMATLTGAARTALGPDLAPFYVRDDRLSAEIWRESAATADPVWRMPLWQPYEKKLSSRIADLNNVTADGFAGSVTAALFLGRFVEKTRNWVHFDIYGWNPNDRPHGPMGGEAQAIRALEALIARRYSLKLA